MYTQKGFSMLELLVVLALIGILIGLVAPSFKSNIQDNNLAVNTNELVSAISYARMEAVKRGRTISLSNETDDADWTSGFIVFLDADDDDVFDAGEELRVWDAMSFGMTAAVAANSDNKFLFVFSPTGTVDRAGDFFICDERNGRHDTRRNITLLASGMVRTAKSTVSSGNCSL
ncbi:MAG: type II transport protein GspH [Pseudomonadales bacterium]|nr:type II transport protein GspH [Pseudomonadales bacterium]